MQKRGQVTIFIILGIVVLSIVGFLFMQRGAILGDELGEEELERFVGVQLEPIRTGIENCVEVSLLKSIDAVSMQGGKAFPAETISLNWGESLVAYAYDLNIPRTYFPTLYGFGNEVKKYMDLDEELEGCIESVFNTFDELDLSISEISPLELRVPLITDNQVKQEIIYQLEISRGDYVATIDNMLTVIELPLGRAIRGANAIISCHSGDYNLYPNYNLFCNIGGVSFDWFSWTVVSGENNYGNQLNSNANTIDECNKLYNIYIPTESEAIQLSVLIKSC
ncbi:hypothetical protein HOD61_02920 [archaeon]|jgi:hypothetical protein|nr:hypothetical protein [archaeon]